MLGKKPEELGNQMKNRDTSTISAEISIWVLEPRRDLLISVKDHREKFATTRIIIIIIIIIIHTYIHKYIRAYIHTYRTGEGKLILNSYNIFHLWLIIFHTYQISALSLALCVSDSSVSFLFYSFLFIPFSFWFKIFLVEQIEQIYILQNIPKLSCDLF